MVVTRVQSSQKVGRKILLLPICVWYPYKLVPIVVLVPILLLVLSASSAWTPGAGTSTSSGDSLNILRQDPGGAGPPQGGAPRTLGDSTKRYETVRRPDFESILLFCFLFYSILLESGDHP